jgi:peptide/nickel transport system substrate-binding protein
MRLPNGDSPVGSGRSSAKGGLRRLLRGAAAATGLGLLPLLAGVEIAYYDDNLPTTLNPVLARTMPDVRTSELVFDRLFYRSAITNEPKSRIVTTFERSEDGTQLKLVVREGIKWHDGKDLGPEDVCFTVDVLRDPNTSSENTKEYRETLRSCEVIKGENAALITFDKPYYNPRDRVSFAILPKHVFANTTMTQSDEFNARPIGSGPMKASRGKHEIRLTAVPNAHHAAKIDTLILNEGADPLVQVRTLLSGGIQGIVSVAPSYRPDVRASDDVALKSYDLRSWWFMALNTASPILADKRVRQAIHLSLDRNKLREVTIGVDANDDNPPCEFVSGPFVQSSPFYNRAVPVQERSDLARAKTLMTAAGASMNAGRWVMNGQSVTLRIGMNGPLDGEARDLLNQIGNQLQEAGFDRQVYKVPADEWASKAITGGLKGQFDALIGEWSFGTVEDVNDKFHTRTGGEGARNIFDYSNPNVDELLQRYNDAHTDTEAQDAYHDLHALLADELPYIFLWKLDTKSAWRNEIKNGTITPFYYFTEFDGWRL